MSPEVFHLPGVVNKFTKAGLTFEICQDLILGKNNRDIVADAKRLLPEFLKDVSLNIYGKENLQSSGLIAFNHPNNNIIIPAFLSLIIKVNELVHKDVSLLMASEIMMSSHFNKKVAIPGSIAFMKRFHNLYGKNIISSPTVMSRKDYLSGRALATRKIIKQLHSGQLVAIAPEGHVEINNEISPPETYHGGTGAIAKMASRIGLPTVPVGIWKEEDIINIKIGNPIKIFSEDNMEATNDLMRNIALNLPEKYRGPFRYPSSNYSSKGS